jgi:glycosyltransferase involved in cell wall biosynthesis
VVHFHHYVHIGIEHLRVVRETLPNTRIIVTLHEYLAICDQHGQMITTTGDLCLQSSPLRCSQCRGHSPANMFFREHFIKSHFEVVDHFIAPSRFLRQRYLNWGLAADKISVLENGLPYELLANTTKFPAELSEHSVTSFAYFGQINPFKGLNILLEAVNLLPKAIKKRIRVEIHGTHLEHQSEDFQKQIHELLKQTQKTVRYLGAYESMDVINLMQHVDWIIVPSIWWENSPLVIQEAFAAQRPVIVSNIGGMAEKVEDGVCGYHFRHHNAIDLARVMEKALDNQRYQQLKSQLPIPITATQSAQAHLNVYFD